MSLLDNPNVCLGGVFGISLGSLIAGMIINDYSWVPIFGYVSVWLFGRYTGLQTRKDES